jgi:hypothetical protein
VLASLRVAEALGKTKVDDVDVVLLLANADQEVVWLDISVKEVPRVHKFDPLKLKRHTGLRESSLSLPSGQQA